MTIKFTNNATSTLASGINSSVTSLSVASGQGGLFPTLSGADVFYATISNTAGAIEIVKVTGRSTDALTIVRGQDGTSGLSWLAGDKVELRATAAGLAAMAQTANNLSDLASASTARTNLGLGSDATGSNLSSLTNPATARTNLGVSAAGALSTNWTISESGGKLTFSYIGVAKFSIDSSGNVIASTNITAYGTP